MYWERVRRSFRVSANLQALPDFYKFVDTDHKKGAIRSYLNG